MRVLRAKIPIPHGYRRLHLASSGPALMQAALGLEPRSNESTVPFQPEGLADLATEFASRRVSKGLILIAIERGGIHLVGGRAVALLAVK